jgi:glutamate-1-semialdehyde 2,1-aminomutase
MPLELEVAETVCRLVPCADLIRFSSSGSEVDQAALRAARAHTGRNKYIRFEGHYHGWFDNVAWSINPPLDAAGPDDAPVPVAWCGGMARRRPGGPTLTAWGSCIWKRLF